ncbi:MAG TPA: arsenate reductase ArsC [Syntrophales bacterium]|nr:arsenate reductase ArsC [Syntrophobacterales bacterium]HNQ00828.1 arsenate reductase ArsC [Syntrophales bacterium]HNS53907.1 arsenate reductase ArsC [Syntrophales bacterium]HQL89245.1 arsenate reductase ArsC [Syntrophales bacterium]
MQKKRVLFVCIHNSARSQMAEAWMNHLCGDRFEAESAGLEPGTLNPLAVAVMQEAGIDISGKSTRSVFDVLKAGTLFSFVVTVCDESAAEACPIFPGPAKCVHMGFTDPARVEGTEEEKLARVRLIRDAVRRAVEEFCRRESGEHGPAA